MDPLRKVEILPPDPTYRLAAAEGNAPPRNEEIPSRRFAEIYLDFLDTLSPLERRVVAERVKHGHTGAIADRVGIDDAVSNEFPIYSTYDPDEKAEITGTFDWRTSETVDAIVKDLDARWVAAAVEAGIDEPYDGDFRTYANRDHASTGYFKGHDGLVQGFERVVAEIIYGDYQGGYPAENPHPHIVELMTDGPRLRELVGRWYDENYEARTAAEKALLAAGVNTEGDEQALGPYGDNDPDDPDVDIFRM